MAFRVRLSLVTCEEPLGVVSLLRVLALDEFALRSDERGLCPDLSKREGVAPLAEAGVLPLRPPFPPAAVLPSRLGGVVLYARFDSLFGKSWHNLQSFKWLS